VREAVRVVAGIAVCILWSLLDAVRDGARASAIGIDLTEADAERAQGFRSFWISAMSDCCIFIIGAAIPVIICGARDWNFLPVADAWKV
jgi:hypothetical protein